MLKWCALLLTLTAACAAAASQERPDPVYRNNKPPNYGRSAPLNSVPKDGAGTELARVELVEPREMTAYLGDVSNVGKNPYGAVLQYTASFGTGGVSTDVIVPGSARGRVLHVAAASLVIRAVLASEVTISAIPSNARVQAHVGFGRPETYAEAYLDGQFNMVNVADTFDQDLRAFANEIEIVVFEGACTVLENTVTDAGAVPVGFAYPAVSGLRYSLSPLTNSIHLVATAGPCRGRIIQYVQL